MASGLLTGSRPQGGAPAWEGEPPFPWAGVCPFPEGGTCLCQHKALVLPAALLRVLPSRDLLR